MADDNKLRFPIAGGSYARSQPEPADDPLAELARLIGQSEQPGQQRRDFSATLRRSAATPVANEEAYDPHEAPRGYQQTDYAARIYGYQPRRSTTPAVYADEAPAAEHDAYYDDAAHAPDPAPAEAAYEEDYGYDQPVTLAPRRRGRWLAVAAVLALAVVGTAGAFGYRSMKLGGHAGQPPVIVADKTPTKIVAPVAPKDSQAGVIRPIRSDTPQDSKVVVREEQPVEMREAKAAPPNMLPYASGAAGIAVPAQLASPLTTGTTSTASMINPNEPRKVHTLTIRPDGSIASQPTLAQGGSSRGLDLPTATVPHTGASAKTSAAAPKPAPTRLAAIPPNTPSAPSHTATRVTPGSHVVQLTSQRSEAEAQSSFRSLQGKYPSILGGRQALIRKVDLGQRGTYYRAQVGPFASAEQANELCGQLKAAGGQCIVQRN
jgi:hypothetical protein